MKSNKRIPSVISRPVRLTISHYSGWKRYISRCNIIGRPRTRLIIMYKTHVTISLAIDNLWFGLTNYKSLIPLDHKNWQAHNSIENAYRIFEYSFVKNLIRSLSFRIFVLALLLSLMDLHSCIDACGVCTVQLNLKLTERACSKGMTQHVFHLIHVQACVCTQD